MNQAQQSTEIWGIIKANQKGMQELRESQQKTDKQIEQMVKENAISRKNLDKQIQKIGANFNGRWGALVESLVEGRLVNIFQDYGIDITQTYTRCVGVWKKPDGSSQTREFDILVANGTEAVVVEVKTSLTPRDIPPFLENLKNFKNYFSKYKSESIYGAMGYLSSIKNANFLAEQEGLFVIKATGDSASLVNQKNFKPKVFSS